MDVPLPPKDTVRAGLATLGLADKDKPSLTSTKLVNSSPLKLKYISLVSEQLLGENYNDESLTILKPHHISAASFQTPSASKLLSQPKAPTVKKSKKKKILPSSQPKVSNDSKEMNPPSTTTYLQATKEFVVNATPLQSLDAFVTTEVQDNQPKVPDTTEEESADIQEDSDSNLQSMLDDDLRPISEFQATDSDDTHANEVSQSAKTSQDDLAFVERQSIPDHLDHICEEVSYLHFRLRNIESSIDVKDLLEPVVIIDETTEGEKKQKDTNAIPALTQGKHKTNENIAPPEPSPETQGACL
ncbi:hypothetical protein Tco_0483324 [Tanacetum coccineum]